MIVHKTLY